MPVPAAIAHAAEEFRYNNNFTVNFVKDLSLEDWTRRPEGASNHVAWIVGHIIWARTAVLSRLGSKWSAPWLGLFARGERVDEAVAYPSPDVLMAAWEEVAAQLASALEDASDDRMSAAFWATRA